VRDGAALGSVLLFGLLCTALPVGSSPFPQIWQAPLATMLVVALAAGPTEMGRWLSARPFVRLGDASYSLYIVHIIPLTVLGLFLGAIDP